MGNDNTNWGQSVTGVIIKDNKVLLVRHNYGDGKNMRIVPGGPKSDSYENSEVLWADVNEALERKDVPDLTKKLIDCALRRENGFKEISYKGNLKNGDYSLYGIK